MRIHIDIRNDIDPALALTKVKQVIEQGKLSNDGKNYCWITEWSDDIVVYTRDNRKSDCFVVYKKGEYEKSSN
jgi:hypothetical protein